MTSSAIDNYYTLTCNTAGSVVIPISCALTPLAFVSLTTDIQDLIIIRACIGWEAISNCAGLNRTDILYKIWRGAPITGKMVCSVLDSGESNYDKYKVTTFGHIDKEFTGNQSTSYMLTAEIPSSGGIAHITGCLSFICSKLTNL